MKKTIFDKSALMVIASVCLLSVLVSGFKAIRLHNVKCPDINILVSTASVVENTPFAVSFANTDATSWDWDFGDNTPHGNTAKVTHTYRTAGQYTLKLVVNGNEKCSGSKQINVAQDISATSNNSDVIQAVIEGPTSVTVGAPAKFKETSGKATSWAWTSTESQVIDGTGQEITYNFKTPGKKTIYVTINGNKGRQSVDIDVIAKGPVVIAPKISQEKFKEMLIQVVDRKIDAGAFGTFLGGNLKMTVTVMEKGKGKPIPFDEFCKEIRKKWKRTEFDDINLTYDGKGCVNSIVVQKHTGKLGR